MNLMKNKRLFPDVLSTGGTEAESFDAISSRLINRTLVTAAILAVPVVAASVLRVLEIGWKPIMALHIMLLLVLWSTVLGRGRCSYGMRVFVLLSILFVVAMAEFWSFGSASTGTSFLLLAMIYATILLGTGWGVAMAVACCLSCAVFGFLVHFGHMTYATVDFNQYVISDTLWIGITVDVLLFTGISVICLGLMRNSLITTMQALSTRTSELEKANARLLRGIEEREYMEETLRESEEKHKTLVENIPGVVWTSDENGNTSFISSALERVYGYTPEEIYEKGHDLWFGRIHADDIERVQKAFEAVLKESVPLDVEYRIRRKDGEWIWLSDRSFGAYVKNGVKYADGIFYDITKRKKAEEAQKIGEQRLALAHEVAGMGMFDWNIVQDRAVCNERYFGLFGLEPRGHMLSQEDWLAMVYPGDRERAQKEVTGTLTGKAPYDTEYRVVWPDKSVKWIQSKASVFYDDEGIAYRMIGAMTDITSRKQAEVTIRESEERFRHLSEAAFEGIAFTDKGILVDANDAFVKMYGCSLEELKGAPVMELVVPEHRALVTENIRSNYGGRYEHRGLRKDGNSIDLEVHGRSVMYRGRSMRLTAIRDITERKQAQERLVDYQERLRSLASELSLTEEHERRTMAGYLHDGPCQQLAVCLLKMETLRSSLEAAGQEPIAEVCTMIHQTVQDLRNLTFDLSPPTLYLVGLEAAIEELLKEELRDKHKISYQFKPAHVSKLLGDDLRALVFQSVRELLNNIVKYAQAEKVTVSTCREGHSIKVAVEDDGIGFDINTIGSNVSKTGGYGLFNMKERLTYIGGQLEVWSDLTQGSRFVITVPLEEEEHLV